MPKITDTRIKTREVAVLLASRGEEPTARKVRQLIGSGSLSTITNELSLMKAEGAADIGNRAPIPLNPPAPPAPGVSVVSAQDALAILQESARLAELMSDMTKELGKVHAELAAQRASSEQQLKIAYERYGAVQRQALMQIDAARLESTELRERLRNYSVDAQGREDALRGKIQQLRDENQRLLGRIEEMNRQTQP